MNEKTESEEFDEDVDEVAAEADDQDLDRATRELESARRRGNGKAGMPARQEARDLIAAVLGRPKFWPSAHRDEPLAPAARLPTAKRNSLVPTATQPGVLPVALKVEPGGNPFNPAVVHVAKMILPVVEQRQGSAPF